MTWRSARTVAAAVASELPHRGHCAGFVTARAQRARGMTTLSATGIRCMASDGRTLAAQHQRQTRLDSGVSCDGGAVHAQFSTGAAWISVVVRHRLAGYVGIQPC